MSIVLFVVVGLVFLALVVFGVAALLSASKDDVRQEAPMLKPRYKDKK